MSLSNESTISMSIDTKKGRLRLHKSMIHSLGDPKFIQLLVNPEKRMVAIRPLRERGGDRIAHQVLSRKLLSDDCVEIYSRVFVKTLVNLVPSMKSGTSYRLYGTITPHGEGAVFSLESLQMI